jgi:hypothetical protein
MLETRFRSSPTVTRGMVALSLAWILVKALKEHLCAFYLFLNGAVFQAFSFPANFLSQQIFRSVIFQQQVPNIFFQVLLIPCETENSPKNMQAQSEICSKSSSKDDNATVSPFLRARRRHQQNLARISNAATEVIDTARWGRAFGPASNQG